MSKRTLKDWFYLEMVSHRAIDDIMQTPKKEVHFFFFSVCCIVFNCSWQLIMFDKKQKSCVKRTHLVTDDGLYNRKAFYKVKIVFLFILYQGRTIFKQFWVFNLVLILKLEQYEFQQLVKNHNNTKFYYRMREVYSELQLDWQYE